MAAALHHNQDVSITRAAGANFDFGSDTVGPLMEQVGKELETLPS